MDEPRELVDYIISPLTRKFGSGNSDNQLIVCITFKLENVNILYTFTDKIINL